MFCPSCGTEIAVELKYCNRCGANLSLPAPNTQLVTMAPVKLTIPSIVLGLTIVLGLLITIAGVGQMALVGVPAVALVWIVLFAVATLFGCTTMMIRFWTKLIMLQRESANLTPPNRPSFLDKPQVQQLPPRLEDFKSVTENTTRTFSPVYSESADRGTKEY